MWWTENKKIVLLEDMSLLTMNSVFGKRAMTGAMVRNRTEA